MPMRPPSVGATSQPKSAPRPVVPARTPMPAACAEPAAAASARTRTDLPHLIAIVIAISLLSPGAGITEHGYAVHRLDGLLARYSTRPMTLPVASKMNIACPPGYARGFSSGDLRFVNSTRTCHLSLSCLAVNVQGVALVHRSFT